MSRCTHDKMRQLPPVDRMSAWPPTADSLNLSTSASDTEPPASAGGISSEWTDIIHTTAVTSLVISLIVSTITLIYLFRNTPNKIFWKWRISERLVVYLAVCDLVYSFNHLFDHATVLATHRFPPRRLCEVFGFFLGSFACTQAIIVSFTALNAFSLLVKRRNIGIGRYDWRLISASIILPFGMSTVFLALGLLGPDVAWCMANNEREEVIYVNSVYAISLFGVLVLCVVCYTAVMCQISTTRRELKRFTDKRRTSHVSNGSKSNRAAFTMSLFIMAFMLQWILYVIYSIWSFFDVAHPAFLTVVVVFCNMGGVFNCLAYTVIRNTRSGTDGASMSAQSTKTKAMKTKSELSLSQAALGEKISKASEGKFREQSTTIDNNMPTNQDAIYMISTETAGQTNSAFSSSENCQ